MQATTFTHKNISENATYIELSGDMYGRLCLIANENGNIYFSYSGEIIAQLIKNRCKYKQNTPERVKKYIREFIKGIKAGKINRK